MKKAITVLMIGAILVSSLSMCSLAAYEDEYMHQEIIEPRYEVISNVTAYLFISESGQAACDASASTFPGYRVEILAELQRQEGRSWTTIRDWDGSGDDYAGASGYWYVMPGYSYRLKVTVTIYDSNGRIIESPVEYSKVEEY